MRCSSRPPQKPELVFIFKFERKKQTLDFSLLLIFQILSLTRFLSLDNTEEPDVELPEPNGIRFQTPMTPLENNALNETFRKFVTPPQPMPRSILKNTITKQASVATIPSSADASEYLHLSSSPSSVTRSREDFGG